MANKLLKTLNFGGTDVYDLAPNWKNVEDRPFGYETPTGGDTLTWDGNTNGLEGVMGILYRVHEATPTAKEGTLEINANGTVTSTPFTVEDKNDGVQYLVANNVTMAVIVPTDGITVDGLKFNKAGIYLRKSGSEYVSSLTIKDCEDFAGIKTLDYQYLPKSLRFGSEVTNGEIIPLVELVPMGGGMFIAPMECPALTIGSTYTVVWNGVTYNTLCVEMEDEPFIGNVGVLSGGTDTGEPFICGSILEGDALILMVISLLQEEAVTMSLTGEIETVTKIDAKYLPSTLRVILDCDENEVWSADRTYEEIKKAYINGLNVYAHSPYTGANVALNYFDDYYVMFFEMCSNDSLRTYRIGADGFVDHTQYDLQTIKL